ncbi:MAG: hypothetical protein ACXWJK_17660 [Burkholderiaceae bacterium]
MILAIPALANPKVTGYFEGAPGFGGARNRMCIKELPDKRLDVNIASGYCPSKECMNFRPDGLWFQAKLKSNVLHYTNKTGCKLDVLFSGNGATVIQKSQCIDDSHPYLYADGSYKFVKAEVDENDCAP